MFKYTTIGLAIVCVALVIIIIRQRVQFHQDYEEMAVAYEDERILREVEKACKKIFLDHYKAEKDREIKMLREALHASEEKRKELCTRLWEEEKLK